MAPNLQAESMQLITQWTIILLPDPQSIFIYLFIGPYELYHYWAQWIHGGYKAAIQPNMDLSDYESKCYSDQAKIFKWLIE